MTPRAREEILSILLNGLKRLEYRGYDSAGYYSVISYFSVVTVYMMAYFTANTHSPIIGIAVTGIG